MFTEIAINALSFNPFDKIGRQWMLITAAHGGRANTMTASWGGLGFLWNKPVATIYVRPQRFTHEFLESAGHFTLSFLPESCRGALNLCGSKSGRDCKKIEEAGLDIVEGGGTVYFEQAELVFICKKIYRQEMEPTGFLDAGIGKNYPNQDYHTVYIGEILQCLTKQKETAQSERC